MSPSGAEDGKLFVGGVSAGTTEEMLRAHFSRYGTLRDCVVLMDRSTGRSRGFAFVQFDSGETAAAVCADKHVLDGREVDVKLALPRDSRLKVQEAVDARLVAGGVTKVFVGGLAANTNDASFRAYFSQFGELQDAVVLCEPGTRRSRGFGFVTFATPEAVDRLFQGGPLHPLDGRMVEVKPAVPKEALPRMRGPMGQGGGLPGGHNLHSRGGGHADGGMQGGSYSPHHHQQMYHHNGVHPAAIAHYYQQAADAYAAAAAVASSSGAGSPGGGGGMYSPGGGSADGPYAGSFGYAQPGPGGWGRPSGGPPMWRPVPDGSDGGDVAPGGITFGMMPHDIRGMGDGSGYGGEYSDGAAAMYAYGAYAANMQQQAMAMAGARRGAALQQQQQRVSRAGAPDGPAAGPADAHEQPAVPLPEPLPDDASDGFLPQRQARRSRGASTERVCAAPLQEVPT